VRKRAKDLSCRQQLTCMLFKVQISIAPCDPSCIEDRSTTWRLDRNINMTSMISGRSVTFCSRFLEVGRVMSV